MDAVLNIAALADELEHAYATRTLCLGELASAITSQTPEEPLAGGEIISAGTLTEAPLIAPGQTWTATLEGIDLSELTLTTTA